MPIAAVILRNAPPFTADQSRASRTCFPTAAAFTLPNAILPSAADLSRPSRTEVFPTAALIRRSACPSAADLRQGVASSSSARSPWGAADIIIGIVNHSIAADFIDRAIAIVVETITDLCRSNTIIAGIAYTIAIDINLVGVRDGSTVIYGVWDPIVIRVSYARYTIRTVETHSVGAVTDYSFLAAMASTSAYYTGIREI